MREDQEFTTAQPMKCIWMTAGVVQYKLCDYQYDCENCGFDRAIRQRFPVHERVCEITNEQGYKVDESLFYHPKHIWMRVEEEGKVRVGLDDFGQKLLGRIYSTHLPDAGERIHDGCWSITHQFGEVSLSGGMDGLVVQKNQQLEQFPSLINSNPYDRGWIFILEPKDLLQSLKSLYYGKKVKEWFADELNKLRSMLVESTPDVGITVQDGGTFRDDFRSFVNAEIINKFLRVPAPNPGAHANLKRR
jgi:glycine cleavage system H lipoate-binding protein